MRNISADIQKNAPITHCMTVHKKRIAIIYFIELSISADSIFYPEKPSKDSEVENLLRMLSACDERSLEVVKATVKALIDTAPEK